MDIIIKQLLGASVVATLLGFGNAVSAEVLTVDMLQSPAAGIKYGWDWDEGKPIPSTAVGGAPGFGDSAWFSDVAGSASGGGRDYTALRLFPEAMFATPITVGEIEDITYWTNYVSGSDWQVKIYTKDADNGAGWYDHRANVARPTGNANNTWEEHSAVALADIWIRDGANGASSYGNSWADMIGAIGNEEIMFIDIIASYATSSPASYSYLDGITISTTTRGSLSLDLEVPEPGVLVLLALGLVGVGLRGRRRV